MSVDGTFRVEDFLEAITSQLDRTQDSLRLKAVNRPLTYAIRDFSLDLKVFVELDPEGQVRFRSSGPNDTGASTVSIGFTTITRPMIEENTIGLEEVQSPALDELGLDAKEQRSLEKIGVRNAAQLKRLHSSSGEGALVKFSNVPVNRLRAALQASRPQVVRLGPDREPPNDGSGRSKATGEPSVRVPRGTRRLRLDGANLSGPGSATRATLDGMNVPVVETAGDHLVVDLGNVNASGRLEIDIPGSETLSFQLEQDDGWDSEPGGDDPWSPE